MKGPAAMFLRQVPVLLIWSVVMVMVAPSARAQAPRAGDDDVMRPTDHGLRLTPRMAQGYSRMAVRHGLADRLNLSDDQVGTLSEAGARRVMEMAHQDGARLQALVETFFEIAPRGPGAFDEETSRRLAESMVPVIPSYRRMLSAFEEDALPHLDASQREGLREVMRKATRDVDALEAQMNRWIEGDFQPGETPFNPRREDEEDEAQDPEEARRKRAIQNAERQADWAIRMIGPRQWEGFVSSTVSVFDFDEAQKAEAEAILGDYTSQADALMDETWKSTLRRNRIRYFLPGQVPDLAGQPLEPWKHQLDREYAAMVRPIEELGRSLRHDVMGLVRDDQRRAVVESMRERGSEHGMTTRELEAMANLLIAFTRR